MRSKVIIAIMTVLIMSGLSVLVVGASSHNDAPLIAEDPTANNTDVYAFVSTEEGRSDYVTLIANYIPLVEPGDGPTYKSFSDQVLYEIMVDVDGDAKEDITYQFEFENDIVNGNTVLYNLGKIGLPSDPGDPSSQYANLNVHQSYTLTEVTGDRRSGKRHQTIVLEDARVAPAHVGPRSTGSAEEYEELANAAIHTKSTDFGDVRVFVGPRDEGFYFDLIGTFDLLNLRDPGFDTFNGYNVYTLALEIPKSRFEHVGGYVDGEDDGDDDGDDNDNGSSIGNTKEDGIIGVWASASRPKVTVLRKDAKPARTSKRTVQVSRLGNPVVNEALNPLSATKIHTKSTDFGDVRVFVGPRDEGFYFDLIGTFDLLNLRDPGFDTFNGYNVYTLALEIPKSRFEHVGGYVDGEDDGDDDGDDNDNGSSIGNTKEDGIIGVWASASRPKVTVLRKDAKPARTSKRTVQVSRLGNPVVNEALNPLSAKDLFNASEPKDDEKNDFDEFIINPGLSQGGAALVPLINGLTGCTPENGRIDLEAIFLTGINQSIADGLASAVPSLAPFAEEGGNFTGSKRAEMLRLNYNVAPSMSPSPLGLLGGDPAGFPNGRRVGDDVVDVALIGAGGGVLHVLGAIDCAVSLGLTDNVDANDVPYLTAFPYLGTPHQGYEHSHSHGGPVSITTLGIGSGLTVTGLVLAGLIAVRRRRSSIVG